MEQMLSHNGETSGLFFNLFSSFLQQMNDDLIKALWEENSPRFSQLCGDQRELRSG
jgi:hypothetical protein